MKNGYLFKLLVVIAFALTASSVSAYNFVVDGIYYNILSAVDNTVEVTNNDATNSYKDNVVIPAKVTNESVEYTVAEIKMGAFWGSTSLKSVEIPEGVTAINAFAFAYCQQLAEVKIPSTIKVIRDDAFRDCYSLSTIDIPENVEEIGTYAFYNCFGLATINALNDNPAACQETSFEGVDVSNCVVNVPTSAGVTAYKLATGWDGFTNIVATSGVDGINANAGVKVQNVAGGIILTGAEGQNVKVFTATGALVVAVNSYAGEMIELQAGMYLVNVGKATIKILK